MMGEQNNQQDRLFYNFNLEEMVPANHLLRHINEVLDLKDLRSHLAPYYRDLSQFDCSDTIEVLWIAK